VWPGGHNVLESIGVQVPIAGIGVQVSIAVEEHIFAELNICMDRTRLDS
jgi:hypothetical protein